MSIQNTIIGWLHKIVAHPAVYEAVQTLAGARHNRERLARQFAGCAPGAWVIDIGGGTGAIRQYLPRECRYVCIDLEWPKLQGFRSRGAEGWPILGDASMAPIGDGSADYVLASAMCHHLDDEQLQKMLQEISRILKPSGRLVLLDPVFAPKRIIGRALWALDRGSFPRTADALARAIARCLTVVDRTEYAIYHEYILAVATK